MWGPLVLAGDLGAVPKRQPRDEAVATAATAAQWPVTPVLVTAASPVGDWVKPSKDKPGVFLTAGAGRDRDVELVPFYRLHRRVYAAYWDVLTPEEWAERAAAIKTAEEARRKLEAATVAFVQPGQMQAERDFNQQGGKTSPAQLRGRYGRRAADWFSFDLPVDPSSPLDLIVTYSTEERADRAFVVLVDGRKIGEQRIARRSPQEKEQFFDVAYPIPRRGRRREAEDHGPVRRDGGPRNGDGLRHPHRQGHVVSKDSGAPRIWEIDFLRGVAIILMVCYHLLFDLGEFVGIQRFLGWSTDLTKTAWIVAQFFFAGLFVVLSGTSGTLSRNNVRRGLRLLAVSLPRGQRGDFHLRSGPDRLSSGSCNASRSRCCSTARRSRKSGSGRALGARPSSGSVRRSRPPDTGARDPFRLADARSGSPVRRSRRSIISRSSLGSGSF